MKKNRDIDEKTQVKHEIETRKKAGQKKKKRRERKKKKNILDKKS